MQNFPRKSTIPVSNLQLTGHIGQMKVFDKSSFRPS